MSVSGILSSCLLCDVSGANYGWTDCALESLYGVWKVDSDFRDFILEPFFSVANHFAG